MTTDRIQDEAMAWEEHELVEERTYDFDLSRRSFVQLLGTGLLVTASGGVSFAAETERKTGRRSVTARLHIGADGVITVFTSKVDVGQGARTQLTQAAAEELRVPVERIHLVMADTDVVPNDGGSYGSLTTPRTVPAVRQAAAGAREVLLNAACKKWRVKRNSVDALDGAVIHKKSDRRISYAKLAASEEVLDSFAENVSRDVEVTPVRDWKVLGTPVKKLNGAAVVTGAQQYPSDIQRPGMVYGKVLRPPSYGATLLEVNLSVAETAEGAGAVRDGEFVGCYAPTAFGAQQALERLSKTARWETKPHPSSKDLFALLKKTSRAGTGGRRGGGPRVQGSVEEGMASAKKVLRATYEIPYIQHAPMEPRAAVAEWAGDKLTAWTGTQRPHGVRDELAQAFSMPRERVRVIVPATGCGFGGKHTGEAAVEAARLARAAGKPVSLRWTREEEFTWAYFRPAGVIEIAAGLDEKGAAVAWDFTNINSGGSGLVSPYAIPNVKTQLMQADAPLRQGSYRALASTANNFARESFMDELADAAGADPLAFRLAHLQEPRLRDVLQKSAEKFGWTERVKRKDPGIGIGLACGTEKGSFVAACVEVGIDGEKLVVREVCQAFECGAIQNPANLQSQVEGCIIMGLGGALREEIHFENGVIQNPSFSRYRVPRFKDLPKFDLLFVDRPDLPSVGAGETPIMALAPAIGNAIFHATGQRLRALPLRAPKQV